LVNQKLRHSVKHGEQLLEMVIFARLPTRFMRLKHNKLSIAIFGLYISLWRKVLIFFHWLEHIEGSRCLLAFKYLAKFLSVIRPWIKPADYW
jgi:hypothetical protein